MADVAPELLIVESGGDNLAAQYSRELVDFTIYVIDVAGGDKVPRKGGPGITQSDLLVSTRPTSRRTSAPTSSVMDRDAKTMRGDRADRVRAGDRGVGVADITARILAAAQTARGRTSGPAPATH